MALSAGVTLPQQKSHHLLMMPYKTNVGLWLWMKNIGLFSIITLGIWFHLHVARMSLDANGYTRSKGELMVKLNGTRRAWWPKVIDNAMVLIMRTLSVQLSKLPQFALFWL
jgi:hypothetical protein